MVQSACVQHYIFDEVLCFIPQGGGTSEVPLVQCFLRFVGYLLHLRQLHLIQQ